jgi:hypothetical protein
MINGEKLGTKYVIFSKNETDIINAVVNEVHNDNNTIYLSETFCTSGILVRESFRNHYIKGLKDEHGVDNEIIQSFYKNNNLENIIRETKIDNNNIFNFDFKWYNWKNYFGEKDVLINNYENIFVSRIGFNKKQTKALIFLEMDRRGIDGFGNFYLLEKETEKWVICKTIKIYDRIRLN